MSYKATNWAYDLPLVGSAKAVLVALADMADEDDTCYPGQKKLAAMTGWSQKTIERALIRIESHGLLTRVRRYGPNGWRTSDRYQLNLDVQQLDLPDTVPTSQSDYKANRLQGTVTVLTDTVTMPTRQIDGAEENHQVNHQLEPSVPKPKTKKKPATPLPDIWAPSEANTKYAVENRLDLKHELGQFRAYAAANDRRQVNWDAAFRLWLGNQVKWRKPGERVESTKAPRRVVSGRAQ